MNNFQFISYAPTPGEKHLGIATINYHGKLILRYKIMPTKDGSNFFPVPAAYKVGETYQSAFTLDSNIEKEEVENLIKIHVKKSIQSASSSSPSSFPPISQPPITYQHTKAPTDPAQSAFNFNQSSQNDQVPF